MYRTWRCRVRELIDRIDNPTPDRRAAGITSGRELVGPFSPFHQSCIAVAFEHQVRRAPNVDLGYHVTKARGGPRRKGKVRRAVERVD
jgi:hypothetical protein